MTNDEALPALDTLAWPTRPGPSWSRQRPRLRLALSRSCSSPGSARCAGRGRQLTTRRWANVPARVRHRDVAGSCVAHHFGFAVCCIYHKPREFGESSSSSSDEDEDEDDGKGEMKHEPCADIARPPADISRPLASSSRRAASSSDTESDSSIERRRLRKRRREKAAEASAPDVRPPPMGAVAMPISEIVPAKEHVVPASPTMAVID
jgi:hypothetical protein